MSHTSADFETMLASEVKLAQLSCEELCQEQSNDRDLLSDLNELPVKQRAQIRASLIRDLAAITLELKRQKCAPCTE